MATGLNDEFQAGTLDVPGPTGALGVPGIVAELRAARERWRTAQNRLQEVGGRELPSREALAAVVGQLRGALFPMRLGPPELRPQEEDRHVSHTLRQTLLFLEGLIRLELQYDARVRGAELTEGPHIAELARQRARDFAGTLPMVRAELDADLAAAFRQESGVRSMDEMLLWHPGMRALLVHRLAHRLHQAGLPLLARMAAELARVRTGIDIHPAARVGAGCALQRATGVVIPETAVILPGALIDGHRSLTGWQAA